jgi:hypothetical protein
MFKTIQARLPYVIMCFCAWILASANAFEISYPSRSGLQQPADLVKACALASQDHSGLPCRAAADGGGGFTADDDGDNLDRLNHIGYVAKSFDVSATTSFLKQRGDAGPPRRAVTIAQARAPPTVTL